MADKNEGFQIKYFLLNNKQSVFLKKTKKNKGESDVLFLIHFLGPKKQSKNRDSGEEGERIQLKEDSTQDTAGSAIYFRQPNHNIF